MMIRKKEDYEELIKVKFDEVKQFVLEKNKSYGASVFEPIRIFSKLGTIEQIWVRIDDKLSRLSKGTLSFENLEDTIRDLIGYLVLALVKLKIEKEESKKETEITA